MVSLLATMPSFVPSLLRCLALVLVLGGCGRKTPAADSDDHDAKPAAAVTATEAPLAPNQVQLTQNQVTAIGLKLGRFTTQDVSNVVKATGTLTLPPQNRARVSAYQGGILRALPVAEGQPVARGQVLAELESPDFVQLQQDYLTQRNQFTFLAADYNRQKALLAEQVGVAKNVQQTAANYNAARATLRSLEERLTTLGIAVAPLRAGRIVNRVPVKAPLTGRLRYQPGLALGASVTPAEPLFEVLNTARLFIDLQVFEQDFGKVRVGQPVRITFPSLPTLAPIAGRVSYIDPAFDPVTKTVKVRAVITNNRNAQLLPGLFANAVIAVGSGAASAPITASLVLPDGALVPEGEATYVYVLTTTKKEADDTEYVFTKQEVRPGAAANGVTAVTPVNPIAANAQIVVAGAFYVQSQQSKGGKTDTDGD